MQFLRLFFSILFVSGALASEKSAFDVLRDETFQAAWKQVGEGYYDASFGGLDWDAVGDAYRAKLANISDMAGLRDLITDMLYELGDSHLSLVSSDYNADELIKPWGGGWSGVALCYRGEQAVFYRVDPEGPAYAAGIRQGDTLLSIDGMKVKDFRRLLRQAGQPEHTVRYSALSAVVSRFRTGAGDRVEAFVRSPGGKKRRLEVVVGRYTGRTTEPFGHLGRMPLELEARRLEQGVGYLRFTLWFPAVMPEIRTFFSELPADAPGLVIDLRGNPGGMMVMAGGLAGLVLDEQATLGRTTLREGHMNVVGFPQRNAFHGKVALLVDEASASTSEVFAIGLQELGRVRVFGQPTPGAALPSVFIALPNGDSLQVALGDFKTPGGVSLEGRGVIPDEIVPISPVDLSEGNDSVISAALNWIHQTN